MATISSEDRIYYYILKVDDGAAPCVDGGVLTLAICKPEMRRKARVGDWLVGFTPKAEGWKLAYAAKITSRIPSKDYYALHGGHLLRSPLSLEISLSSLSYRSFDIENDRESLHRLL